MAELTPFMKQWTAAKGETPDALLFFRMGDFYELFYDDAVTASRELQLTLTARDRERQEPMCGVPYHAVESYLARLLRKGYRIAICDQMEDPKLTKKIVRREVTRVLSPGTALDAGLGQEQNNFLAALFRESSLAVFAWKKSGDHGAVCAIALLDVSTGEFRTAEFAGANARQQATEEILLAGASEVLMSESAEPGPDLERVAARTRVRGLGVDAGVCRAAVRAADAGAVRSRGSGWSDHPGAAIAAGAVVHYVRTTQRNEALHIDFAAFEEHSTALELDQVTVRNLELVEPLFDGTGSARHALPHFGRVPNARGQAAVAGYDPASAQRCRRA